MQHIFSWTLKVSLFSPSQLVHNGKGERWSHRSEGWPEYLLIKHGDQMKFAWFFFLIVGKHHHYMYNSLVFHLLKSCWVCSQCCPFISPWSKQPYDEHSNSMPWWLHPTICLLWILWWSYRKSVWCCISRINTLNYFHKFINKPNLVRTICFIEWHTGSKLNILLC